MFNVQFIGVLLCNFGVYGCRNFALQVGSFARFYARNFPYGSFPLQIESSDYTELNFRDVEFVVCKEIALQVSGLTTMIVAMVQNLNKIQLFMHRPKIPKIFWKYQASPLAKLQKVLGFLGRACAGFGRFILGNLGPAQAFSQHLKMENLLCVVQSVIEPWFEHLILEMSHVHKTLVLKGCEHIRTGKMEQMVYVWSKYSPSPR